MNIEMLEYQAMFHLICQESDIEDGKINKQEQQHLNTVWISFEIAESIDSYKNQPRRQECRHKQYSPVTFHRNKHHSGIDDGNVREEDPR